MNRSRIALFFLVAPLLMYSCSGSATNTPSAITPAPVVSQTPDPAPSYPVINTQNVSQLTPILKIGWGSLEDAASSPDGEIIAAVGSQGIWLFSTKDLSIISHFQAHIGVVNAVAWSPDGTRLVTGGADNTVRVWDAASGDEIMVLTSHQRQVNDVVWSPDGKLLASSSDDEQVFIWSATNGSQMSRFLDHDSEVHPLAFSPDSATLASGDISGDILLVDVHSGQSIQLFKAHEGWVTDISWSPDGTQLSSSGLDRSIHIWSMIDQTIQLTLNNISNATSLDWSGIRNTILAGSGGPFTIRTWQADTGSSTGEIEGATAWINTVEWLPDGIHFITLSDDSNLQIWDGRFGQLIISSKDINPLFTDNLNALSWSPDGETIASGSLDRSIQLWNASDGRLLKRLIGHGQGITSLAWSIDNSWLASSSTDGKVLLWDPITWEISRELTPFDGPINHLAWPQRGDQVAFGTTFGSVHIYNAISGQEEFRLYPDTGVESVGWTPNSSLIAAGTIDGSLHIWETETGQRLHRIEILHSPVEISTWSPDGRTLLAIDRNGSSILVDTRSGDISRRLEGNHNLIRAAEWSPDGNLIAAVSDDSTILIWDSDSGTLVSVLTGHTSALRGVAWSPDGRQLASTGHDGNIIIWAVAENSEDSDTKKTVPLSETLGDALILSSTFIDKDNAAQIAQLDQYGFGKITSINVGPHSQYFSATGTRGTWIFDISLSKSLFLLAGAQTYQSAWAHNHQWLAVRELEQVIIWDLENKHVLMSFPLQYSMESDLAWSHDDRFLVTGDLEGNLDLWNLANGQIIQSISINEQIQQIIWQTDNQVIALVSNPEIGTSKIILWDPYTGEMNAELRGQSGLISDIAITTHNQLAAASSDGSIWIWDLTSYSPIRKVEMGIPFESLAWSEQLTRMIFSDTEGTISSISIREAEAEIISSKEQNVIQLEITSDNKLILLLEDGSLKYGVDEEDAEIVPPKNAAFQEFRITLISSSKSSNGKWIAGANADNLIILDADSRQVLSSLKSANDYKEIIYAPLAWSPREEYLAWGSGITIRVINTLDWEIYSTLTIQKAEFEQAFTSISWSPDGSQLAATRRDGRLYVWDINNAQPFSSWDLYSERAFQVSWSQNGEYLAVVGSDGIYENEMISVIDLESGNVIFKLPVDWAAQVSAVSWSPDDQLLAVAYNELFTNRSHLQIWDWLAEIRIIDRPAQNDIINKIEWTDDQTSLLLTSQDGTTSLWGILP